MTTSARPALPRRNPRLSHLAAGLCLATAALAARADIAVLREKGPHSGSAFSNPGLVADAPAGLKVTMKNADVKIHLRPGEGDSLKADVTADFEIEDSSPTELAGQLYLVGFPVTGLSSKIVTIDNFAVKVDGKEPATVLRRSIGIRFNQVTIQDTPIAGILEERFALKKEQRCWGIDYPAADNYRASYVWQQVIHPGTAPHIQVTYTVTLRPQSVHYTKSYDNEESDMEVIPRKNLNMGRWDDQYYFFDYVLRSGATWDGTIGKEVVEITSDSALKLSAAKVGLRVRKPPTFYVDEEHELPEFTRPMGRQGTELNETDPERRSVRWTLENGDPTEDLLISIPISAFKR